MEAVHNEIYKGLNLAIYPDQYAQNPREMCEELGNMMCWHRRYQLGDENPHKNDRAFLSSLAEDVSQSFAKKVNEGAYNEYNESEWLPKALDIVRKKYVILPLYLYDHSGITMRTTSFYNRWDSGQVGWIYATLEDAKANWMAPKATWSTKLKGGKTLREMTTDCLTAEVSEYDDFLVGNVYGYQVKDDEDNHLESCWGYLGDMDYCLKEARNVIDHIRIDLDKKQAAKAQADAAEKLEREYWESRDVVTC